MKKFILGLISIIGCIIITGGLSTKNLADTKKVASSNNIFSPNKQTETFSMPEVNNAPLPIKEKMLNAIDHYRTVQGTFQNKTPNRNVVVEFIDEVGNSQYSHVQITDIKSGGVKKDSTSNYVQDEIIIIHPFQIAAWLNDESKNYQVISNEKYLNRDVTVIEGKLDPLLSKKFEGTLFNIWVDTETGVLLKLITVNEKNEETSNLEVIKIDFNIDIGKK